MSAHGKESQLFANSHYVLANMYVHIYDVTRICVCVCIHTVFNSVIIQNLDSSWALISIIFSFLVCLKKDWIAKFPGTHSSFILIVMLIHRWGTFALIVVNNLYIPSKTAEG